MSANLWPGDVIHLQDRMYGLDPGLYVVSDFSFGMVELRGTWRNEDGLLSPTAEVHKLTLDEICHPLFKPLGQNLFCDADRAEL